MAEERNIRNTQYSVQVPIVTEEEFQQLIPELGAMVLYHMSNLDTSYLRIGTFNNNNKIIWRQLELKDL